ncbi:MAG: choice-of-anchor D domain-containing protein, partial [Rhodothermia bacterium]
MDHTDVEYNVLEMKLRTVKTSFLIVVMALLAVPAIAQPKITVSPTSHNYGNVDVGKTKAQTFRIRNTGSDTLEGLASLLDDVHFVLTPEDSFSVAPGSFADVIVTFVPTRPGEQFDSLLVAHNDTNTVSPVAISLTGRGIPRPEISVRPLSHDFDTVAVRTSEETVFWVSNPGSGLLTVRASIGAGSPHYEVTTTTDLFTVAAGDSVSVVVRYAPINVTRHTGQLRIDHNGINQSTPIFVALAGVGAQAVTLDPYEPNDVAGEASEIQTGFVSDSTEIWPSGDVDYFSFHGVYGEWLQITADIAPGSDLNSKLWLYDSEGGLVAENDNAGSNDRSQIN